MSIYSAFVLYDTNCIIHRVFLVRKDAPGPALDSESLVSLRKDIQQRYGLDLKPVDLEVTDVDSLKERVKEFKVRKPRRCPRPATSDSPKSLKA